MRKIVIFRDEFVEVKGARAKRVRHVLRAIRPSANYSGFTKNGAPIDSEIKALARSLEPSFTGYYLA
jgi:hypothetical protein